MGIYQPQKRFLNLKQVNSKLNQKNKLKTGPNSDLRLSEFAEQGNKGLSAMQLILESVGYQTDLLPVSKDNPIEQLLVYLDIYREKENEDAIPMIQIVFPGDLIEPVNDNTADSLPTSFLVQFFVALQDIPVIAEKKTGIQELLSVFSKIIPFGFFGFNLQDGIFYRYGFLSSERGVNQVLTVEIVQLINFFIGQFIDKIKSYCNSHDTLDEIIEETERALSKQHVV